MLLGAVFLGIKDCRVQRTSSTHHLVPGPDFHFDRTPEPTQRAEMFFSLYFVMTGLHALHMVIGVGILLVLIALRLARAATTPEYYNPVEMLGPLLALRRHRLDLPLPAPLPDRRARQLSMTHVRARRPVRDLLRWSSRALMVLTALTVGGRVRSTSGPLNDVVALAIAVTKATLVVLFFMHVKLLHAADRRDRRRGLLLAGDPARDHALATTCRGARGLLGSSRRRPVPGPP